MNNNHKDSIISGYINPAGGHIEEGETFEQTVKREAFEEMGIKDVRDITLRGTVNVSGFKENPVFMLIVSGTVDSDIKLEAKDEGEPVWVSENGFKKYRMFEDVEKFVELIKTRKDLFHIVSKFEDRKLVEFTIS